MSLGAGFVRVSTGSQDEISQVTTITEESEQRGITIVKWFKLHGYSASKGEQEPALREAIADIERGDYSLLVVTESRDLTAGKILMRRLRSSWLSAGRAGMSSRLPSRSSGRRYCRARGHAGSAARERGEKQDRQGHDLSRNQDDP